MHNKILHRFFQTIKLYCQEQVQNVLLLCEYGYMRSNLAHLGGYPTHRDVADMSNLFCHFGLI